MTLVKTKRENRKRFVQRNITMPNKSKLPGFTIEPRDVDFSRKLPPLPKNRTMPIEKKPKVELRDYFIAAALTGLCANGRLIEEMNILPQGLRQHLTPTQMVVTAARMIADEMLIERER